MTPKVYLRHPSQDDFEELRDRYRTSRKHLTGFANWRYEREDFDRVLITADLESNEYFLICRTEDAAIVGWVNLSQIFRKVFQNAYLGYLLFAGFTGKGYMTEAVDQVLRFAFRVEKLHRIEANVQPHNAGSIAVLKRNGFRKEGFSPRYLKIGGRWRDHERWAIISENWKPIRFDDPNRSKK
jgi:[ribosomal protein S5]-alanine N-acetyltransferase